MSQEIRADRTHEATDATRECLIEAAAFLCADKGYARATTRALAEAAGVNEVTLFRHFGTKASLFAAVVEAYAAPGPSPSLDLALTGDLEQDLTAMGSRLMNLPLEGPESMRMMLCEAEHFEEVRPVLAAYLQQQQAQGKVCALHVEAAAQAFWGMFFAYTFSRWLLDEEVDPPLSIGEAVSEFAGIFVNGIAA